VSDISGILLEVRRRGIRLVANCGRLDYCPRSAMTADLVERIKENKAAILEAIQFDWDRDTVPVMICPDCGGCRHWQSMEGTWHCARCDPPTVGLAWMKRVERARKRHGQPIRPETRELIADLEDLLDSSQRPPILCGRSVNHG
jgi:TubC N-terminal docking domain